MVCWNGRGEACASTLVVELTSFRSKVLVAKKGRGGVGNDITAEMM